MDKLSLTILAHSSRVLRVSHLLCALSLLRGDYRGMQVAAADSLPEMLCLACSLTWLPEGLFQPDFKSLRIESDVGLQYREDSIPGEGAPMGD